MDEKVSPDEPLPTRTEAEGATVDLPEGLGFFAIGQVLGDRYEILEMLGRGGMGEVWRAFDLKLRVEVGLKALRDDLFQSERRLELLRQEVRAAREVVSPNVCRIFDLHEFEGRELVSMEYVDGATLLGVLQERGPLELKEAQDIASQFLAGLEAIHKAGLVHRDVKPENIMLTRAGRVVVMDFGLARGPESGAGSVSGTFAYMSPEHAAGQTVDARADVYSAGVVLAEMVSPEGIKSYESRQSVWEGVRSEPAQIPDSPWAPVIKRAVARDRDRRQNSAHTLIRELEDVTLRVEGAEDLHPYPGLASFTEEDAEYFFGREAEVESVWRRLEGAHLLAIVGPSGAGKTSFIRAGLTPNAPISWTITRCTPGNAAISSLRKTLVHELAGDIEALEELVDPDSDDGLVSAASRWRKKHPNALLIIDQFEELFTQNPTDEQTRFATLVGRLVIEGDVRVLVSMRDDYLLHCNRHEALRPLFSALTPLDPPTGGALRRAVTQPALKCGYRFEDDELVEEMLAEVEGGRGALPLMAFAAAKLWEKRDRETGFLTRKVYQNIGGVGGALARHAEATVDRIGVERIPVVRELFRNLVTAEGTRAVREWDELLSVFDSELSSLSSRASGASRVGRSTNLSVILSERSESKDPPKLGATTKTTTHSRPGGDPSIRSSDSLTRDDRGGGSSDPLAQDDRRGRRRTPSLGMTVGGRSSDSLAQGDTIGSAAEEVLRELIDARLLTSYEVREDEHEPTRRVEIIHESLLANWPRLVRWMTQDQEGVQLREELRQAARSWDEHGRHDDRLWTGTPYREFRLWQEHYPGGLTGVEEAYAAAMTRHSTRRRRRRRLAATVVFIALLAVLLVVAVSRQQAVAETNRAEAARLVLLGLNAVESDHTAALAFATASLARADTPAGRRLALRALWAGPPATVVSDDGGWELAFSHDGRLVAVGGGDGLLRVFSREGGPPVTVQGFDEDDGTIWDLSFSQDDRYLIGAALVGGGEVRVWETTDWQLHRTLQGPERPRIFPEMPEIDLAFGHFEPDGSAILTVRLGSDGDGEPSPLDETGEWFVRRWPLNGGPSELVGRVSGTVANIPVIDMNRRLLATGIRNELFLHHIDSLGHESPKVIGRNPAPFIWFGLAFDPVHPRLAACDVGGNLRVWSIGGNGSRSERNLKIPWSPFGSTFSPDGALLAQASERWGAQLWDLEGPALSEPWSLGVEATGVREVAFTPDGSWLATAAGGQQPYRLALWPLANDYPRVQLHPESGLDKVRFHPDGSRVFAVVTGRDGVMTIRSWPMTGGAGIEPTVHFRGGEIWEYVVDPLWRFLIVGAGGAVQMVPLDGSEPTIIEGPHRGGLDIDRTGRFLAYKHNESVILHDLESGDQHRFEALGDGPLNSWFLDQPGRVVATRGRVVSRWDPLTGKVETLSTNSFSFAAPLGDGDLLYVRNDEAHAIGLRSVFDTRDGSVTPLPAVHQPPGMISFDWTGSLVRSSHPDGEIRVGPLFSDEPHLLLGHDQEIARGIFSPDGKWIATWASDGTLRLWPVPDLAKPPFHTLPYDELMAKLKALTNLRAVPDPDSHTGYSVKPDFSAYQGWAEVPEW